MSTLKWPNKLASAVTDMDRHMARDELLMITEDNWDEEIWGVESPDPDLKTEIPKLVFYFGQKVSIIDRTCQWLIDICRIIGLRIERETH